MSDYLSSLAARSLRREPACEPRRAQMFEPRQETSSTPFAEEVREGLPGEETLESGAAETPVSAAPPISTAPALYERDNRVATEPRAQASAPPSLITPPDVLDDSPDFHSTPVTLPTQSHLQTTAPPLAAEQSTHSAPPVEAVRETTPPLVARLAQTQAVSHEPPTLKPETPTNANAATEATSEPLSPVPHNVTAISQTPTVSQPPPAYVQAEELADSSRPLVPSRQPSTRGATQTSTSASPSRQTHATAEERGAAIHYEPSTRALLSDALDEEVREQTPEVARRAGAGSRTGRFESESSTTVVDVEIVPQPHASKPPQTAETSIRSDSEPLSGEALQPLKTTTEVRPVPAPPSLPNARAGVLSTPANHTVPTAAREGSAQAPPPTIEVTIGRIEVRAVTPPEPPPRPRERQAPPKMSLDDYLRAHNGGRT
jgi:hypothetical protein